VLDSARGSKRSLPAKVLTGFTVGLLLGLGLCGAGAGFSGHEGVSAFLFDVGTGCFLLSFLGSVVSLAWLFIFGLSSKK
jgi:hypothetical protein